MRQDAAFHSVPAGAAAGLQQAGAGPQPGGRAGDLPDEPDLRGEAPYLPPQDADEQDRRDGDPAHGLRPRAARDPHAAGAGAAHSEKPLPRQRLYQAGGNEAVDLRAGPPLSHAGRKYAGRASQLQAVRAVGAGGGRKLRNAILSMKTQYSHGNVNTAFLQKAHFL